MRHDSKRLPAVASGQIGRGVQRFFECTLLCGSTPLPPKHQPFPHTPVLVSHSLVLTQPSYRIRPLNPPCLPNKLKTINMEVRNPWLRPAWKYSVRYPSLAYGQIMSSPAYGRTSTPPPSTPPNQKSGNKNIYQTKEEVTSHSSPQKTFPVCQAPTSSHPSGRDLNSFRCLRSRRCALPARPGSSPSSPGPCPTRGRRPQIRPKPLRFEMPGVSFSFPLKPPFCLP